MFGPAGAAGHATRLFYRLIEMTEKPAQVRTIDE
jgi:hypothetical protein